MLARGAVKKSAGSMAPSTLPTKIAVLDAVVRGETVTNVSLQQGGKSVSAESTGAQ
jgi:hypothetical protein